jgi:(2Fe-2S) ferredoxin
MKRAFETELRLHDLYRDLDDRRPGGVTILYVSHVGGHKFAANCFIYLNSGESIWLARVAPAHAKGIVDETVIKGRVFPELVRGCFKVDW